MLTRCLTFDARYDSLCNSKVVKSTEMNVLWTIHTAIRTFREAVENFGLAVLCAKYGDNIYACGLGSILCPPRITLFWFNPICRAGNFLSIP